MNVSMMFKMYSKLEMLIYLILGFVFHTNYACSITVLCMILRICVNKNQCTNDISYWNIDRDL